MKRLVRVAAGAAALVLAASMGTALAAESSAVETKAMSGTFVRFADVLRARLSGTAIHASSGTVAAASSNPATVVESLGAITGNATLPLWTFDALSSRDGNVYRGAMVGSNPFTKPGSVSVGVEVIPLVIKVQSVATAIDPSTLAITYTAGNTSTNPSARDSACLAAPNNVPTRLVMQSPIFQNSAISFGGTFIGDTQYIDAMMRGNFWNANAAVASSYHLLLSPRTTGQVVITVPAANGVLIPPSVLASLGITGLCEGLTLVDINWFDAYINSEVLPSLQTDGGVAPTNLPVFLAVNTVWGGSATVGLGNCCVGGYHSYGGFPTPTQTYSVADFDTTGLFGTAFANTAVLSHEIGEWANDPYGINLVPAWGGTGQVAGCQGNLEVGDPLTGSTINVAMPNGFTYQVQELAFFSWFLGAPSVAVNGWYSTNGTFTSDAGTPCLLQ